MSDLVHRRNPMPTITDAVDHARGQLAIALNGWGTLGGWHNSDARIAAPALAAILDTLAATNPVVGPNPWTVNDGTFTWAGPTVRAFYQGDHAVVVATGGHHDIDTFLRLARDHANERFGWHTWDYAVTVAGVQHVHLRSDAQAFLSFTADPVPGSEPVTVWAEIPAAGIVIEYEEP